MNCKPWTLALIGAGIISLPAVLQAEEKPSSVQTALSATTISGFVDTSAQWNFGTGNAHAPNYAFGGSSKADGFNLDVVQLKIEKPVDAADVWGAGYKVDLLFGPDADTLATQSSLSTGASDFAVKQAYVALHAPIGNGVDFKIGVWDTLIGYEVFESINNPNFTRSWGYSIEPTTHTGIQGTYVFGEALSATLGVADTFGSTINQRPTGESATRAEVDKTYMGQVTLTAPKTMGFLAGSTLTGVIIDGYNKSALGTGIAADQTSYYLGATINTPVTGLKVGASYDYAGVSHQPLTSETLSYYAEAVGGYVSYQITEKLSTNVRGEYYWANERAFTADKIVEGTATLQYDLWKNVLSRLELRWDHAADGTKAFGADNGAGGGSVKNSFILLANVAYKF